MIRQHRVDVRALTVPASGATSDITFDQGFPPGPALLTELDLKHYGSITIGTGVRSTSGNLYELQQLFVETDLHGMLVDGVDGIGLHRIAQIRHGIAPVNAWSDTAWGSRIRVQLAGRFTNRFHPQVRPFDCGVLLGAAKMTVRARMGGAGILFSTVGTATTSAANVDLAALYKANPTLEAWDPDKGLRGDLPQRQPYLQRYTIRNWGSSKVEDSLPIGQGRRLYRAYLSERNTSTDAEVSNEFGADDDELTVMLGEEVIMKRRRITDLDERYQAIAGAALPAGWHVLDFVEEGRLADGLDLSDPAKPLRFIFDTPAGTANQGVYAYLDGDKPLSPGVHPA